MDPLTIAVMAAAGVYIMDTTSNRVGKFSLKNLKKSFGKAVAAGSTAGKEASKKKALRGGPAT